MKIFICFLVLASAQAFATETETSTTQIKTTEAQAGEGEEQQLERVKLDTLIITPSGRSPASWSGGGRNFR